ncbi:MAG: PilZ domain-containing protein [Acidobacteria bacterium]|nr:PilZ domain-containing protein [Acidobacteriota bacterium]
MVHSVSSDRRQGRRYLVVGTVVISTPKEQYAAELVNVGSGGMLAFCDAAPALGERVEVLFQVQDYPLKVKVKGRVVHMAVGLVGIGFLEEPDSLDEVLLWLEAGFLACLI